MAASSTPDLKTLDLARQRLWTLSNALQTLKNELQYREPLPPWPSLQDATTLTNHQLQALATHLANAAPLLSSAHAYPSPAFPDNAHQNVAEQLLRKKAEPALDAWCAAGHAAGERITSPTTNETKTTLSNQTLQTLWKQAASTAIASAARVPWGTDFSVAERRAGVARVRHGLARELDAGEGGDSDDDDEEEDDESDDAGDGDVMAVDAPASSRGVMGGGAAMPVGVEDLLRFACAGSVTPALARAGGA